ncbi:MAG: disulfide bond formation protein B [Magnetospirillum sp.]
MTQAKAPDRILPIFVLLASIAALASAYTAQYGFGLRPCVLCLTQRVPFAIAGGLAVLALLRPVSWQRILMALAGLAFLVNSGIAVYHVGVEQKWWMSSCASSAGPKPALGDLASLMSQPADEPRCDEPAWEWHGITMAGLNIVFSGGLALVVAAALTRRKRT